MACIRSSRRHCVTVEVVRAPCFTWPCLDALERNSFNPIRSTHLVKPATRYSKTIIATRRVGV